MYGFQIHLPLVLIVLATAVGFLTTLYGAYYLKKYERTKQVVTFTVLATTITIWVFFALLQLTGTTYGRSYWAYKMLHFGSFTSAPAVLLYGLSAGKARQWVNWKLVSLFVVLLLPVFVFLFTDPIPVLFEDPHLVSFGAFSVIEHGNSPLYVSYLSAFYVIATVGLSYIVYQTWTDRSLSPIQTAILVPAIFAPMLLSIAQTFSLLPFETPGTILTPTSFSLGMAGIGYAAFRYDTFDTKTLARSRTIEKMGEGYLLIDTDGNVIDSNQRAQSLLLIERSPVEGHISALVPEAEEWLLESEESTATFETEIETETETKTLEITATTFHSNAGRTLGTLFIIHDITKRKEFQQQLAEQRDNLTILNEVLRHDIRNDLHLVSSYGDLLSGHVEDDGTEYLDTLRQSADHAVELTKTAREMADLMVSREEIQQLDDINLRKTIETELETIESKYPGAEFSVEGTLPNVQIRGNQMLNSVFRNLLSNAVQHNTKDVPKISVSAISQDEEVVVRIEDNGPGISEERKSDIFGKGKKGLDSSGTGLGLYLVQQLVTLYDGDVWIEDGEPDGAIFAVKLPLAE